MSKLNQLLGSKLALYPKRRLLVTCYFLFIAFHFSLSSSFAQFNPQSKSITEKFFPELEFDISTPAFLKKSGFTNYQEMMEWLNKSIKTHEDKVSLSFIGESQNGKQVPMLIFSSKNEKAKTRVWLQGGLHGDEPAGTEAMLYLTDRLLNDPGFATFLENLEIAIVPMANIDGYEKQQRVAADGMDLNRDQTRLKAKESILLKAAFSAFQPSVALDFHEYRPFRKDFTKIGRAGVTSRYDAMFLYSGNLNVPKVLRDFTQHTFVEHARQVLNENQLTNHDYITTQKYGSQVHFNLGSVHSRSSATNFALANCVSTLLEIRGVGIGRYSFKRRVKASFLIAVAYLETTVKEKSALENVLAQALRSQHPVVVTSDKLTRKDSIHVIDLASEKEMKLGVTIHDALMSRPVLQRERPSAYLISSTEKQAAYKLKVMGIEVDSLATEKLVEVEAYELNNPIAADEDVILNLDPEEDAEASVPSANTRIKKQLFQAGTFVIWLNQPGANLACEILEPENANGFVKMKVIKSKQNQELPIYRYMKSEKFTP